MKTRKIVLALALASIMVVAFALPAFAANVALPLPPTAVNNDNQQGWAVNGTDMNGTPLVTDLTAEQVKSATALVLELSAAPAGDIKFVLQSDGDWGWNETVVPAEMIDGNKVTIDLASMKGYKSSIGFEAQWKCFVGYWGDGSGNFNDLGVTKAYLVTSGGGSSNAKTGDNGFLFIALGILAMAGCATVFVTRKIKAQ